MSRRVRFRSKRIHGPQSKSRYSQNTMSTAQRTTWRQREKEKERLQKEAAALIAQQAFAKTEMNFPTTLTATVRKVIADGPDLAAKVLEAHIQEEVRKQVAAYHAAAAERERQIIIQGVYVNRRRRRQYAEEDEEEVEQPKTLSEQFPPHGCRGTYTEPDGEGWREVTRRVRRKHVLTNAELERLAAQSMDDDEDHADHNGDLGERTQRRDFY